MKSVILVDFNNSKVPIERLSYKKALDSYLTVVTESPRYKGGVLAEFALPLYVFM